MVAKIVTGVCLIAGIALLLAWPIVIGPRPSNQATKVEKVRYARRLALYFGSTCAAFLGAAAGASFVSRQMRLAYLEESSKNFEELVMGTIQDHGGKRDEPRSE